MTQYMAEWTRWLEPSSLGHVWSAFTDTENWLYGSWDEQKYHVYMGLRNVPYFNDYMDYLLDSRADKEYLNRHGLDYTDIHDPRKLHATMSGGRAVGGALNFVSRNVVRLY